MRQVEEFIMPIERKNAGSVAYTYAAVFKGKPWYEASKCGLCGSFSRSNPKDKAQCENCKKEGKAGVCDAEAYPYEPTKKYIASELSKPNASGLMYARMEMIRIVVEDIFAFGWGYTARSSDLVKKYSSEQMRAIVSALLIPSLFYYISEVGVVERKQGEGIGKNITSRLAEYGKNTNSCVVLRTNEDSPMRYIAQNLGMKAIMGMGTGLLDTDNEKRMLFIGGNNERE